jgi:glutathione synthase/RimK-type ligase-like ATP-grasp enzyme
VQIDSLDHCEEWLTREQFLTALEQSLHYHTNDITVRPPWYTALLPTDALDSLNPRFPVLVKANEATITKMSHIMSIAFDKPGLEQAAKLYDEAFIVQEFVNHDKTVYKVYVIGDQVTYKPRESCSNLSAKGESCVTFNSAEPWPDDIKSGERVTRVLNMDVVRDISKRIYQRLGLSVFGFDILVSSETGDYVIVDINVFPSFKEYPTIMPLLEQLIGQRLAGLTP